MDLVLAVLLRKVGETGEDEDGDGQEHEQQAELFVRVTEGEAEALQAGGVSRQLQDAQDSHDTEDGDHPAHVVEPGRLGATRFEGKQRHVERHDRQKVYDVHDTFEKLPLVGRGGKPQEVFDCEPGDADGFHLEKDFTVFTVILEMRNCVEHQGCGWDYDEKHRDNGEDLQEISKFLSRNAGLESRKSWTTRTIDLWIPVFRGLCSNE